MDRIQLTDTRMDVIMKMSDGNIGALSAIMEVISKGEEIDPQGMFGGLGAIMTLDTWHIYGSSIYVLWSHKCQRDTRKFLMLLRAVQLGFLPISKLQSMAADQRWEIDLTEEAWAELEAKVLDKLDGFARVVVKEQNNA